MSFLLMHLMKIFIPFKNTNISQNNKIIHLAGKLMAAFVYKTHHKSLID